MNPSIHFCTFKFQCMKMRGKLAVTVKQKGSLYPLKNILIFSKSIWLNEPKVLPVYFSEGEQATKENIYVKFITSVEEFRSAIQDQHIHKSINIYSGCLLGYNSHHKRWDFPISPVEGFKLGQFLDRHQGFEKVSTEESDDEASGSSSTLQHPEYA